MSTAPTHPLAHLNPAFEQEVHAALSELQGALSALIETLPRYPRRASDLARGLGLERNMAWKLFRLVHERDPFAAARFVPGQPSFAAFLDGAARAGVASELLERVQGALGGYEEVLRRHAGDRAAADLMIGAKAGEAGEQALRRAAFRSMSFLAGVQARASLQAFIFAPSAADPDLMDGVSINGFVDLTRVRPDAPVIVGRAMTTDDQGRPIGADRYEPIDPQDPGEGFVPLLQGFCSSPRPRFCRVPGERGFVENELAPGPVGLTGAATFMAASVIRSAGSRVRSPSNAELGLVTRVRTPAAVLVCDVLMHRDVLDDTEPRAEVFADLFGEAMRRESRDRYRISSGLPVRRLGTGPGAAASPDIPRMPRMLQHVLDRLGWDGSMFEVYRVRIEHPFTPTSLLVSFDLPGEPAPTA